MSGLVRNGLGAAIEHALVLLTPLGSAGNVRTSLTDSAGRYQFDGVDAGTYRITAIREGYEASIGSVSTWIARRMDLVLVPPGEPKPAAPRPDWVLTAPARDILRDIDAAAQLPTDGASNRGSGGVLPAPDLLASREIPSASRAVEILESMDGEIRQSFSQAGADPSGGSSRASSGGTGNTTSLLVGSPIGDRLRWDFLGERSKENTNWREAGIQARQASAERVRVNIRYDTGEVGQLDMRAYYDHDALDFQSMVGEAPDLTNRDRRGWGYDAGWTGSLDDDSSLQVEMRYANSAVGGAHGSKAGRDNALFDDADANANVWRGAARYTKNIGSNHGVHIGVKARYYSSGGSGENRVAPTAQQDYALFDEYGRNGWTMNVSAADSWRMLDPLAVDFGFDVSRSAYTAGSLRQAMVPQAGVTYTPGLSTTVRGAVSYVALERELAGTGAPVATTRGGSETLGYRVRAEQRMGTWLVVILDAESRPCLYDSIGSSWDSPGTQDNARMLYVSDAGSSLREEHLGIEVRPVEGVLVALGAAGGRIEGHVGASIPEQDLLRTFPDGRITYELAHLDGRWERTRTSVHFEMTRLEQIAFNTFSDPYTDRRWFVQVLQGLGFVHPGDTDWSLVLAYTAFHPDENAPASQPDPALHADMRRISGGVSVKF